jgi:ankyrin repeat protein
MLRELLTRGGLDPDYPTSDGVTLLHELCHKDSRGQMMDHRTGWAAILLEFGADPSPKNTHGETPVMWTIRHGLMDIAGFLKSRGAT